MKPEKILQATFKHGEPTWIGFARILDTNDIPRITRTRKKRRQKK